MRISKERRPMRRRWAGTCAIASAVFIGLLIFVGMFGVTPWERERYTDIRAMLEHVPRDLALAITSVGGSDYIGPATVLVISLLPRPFAGRWWLWIVAMLAVSWIEHTAKVLLGRPRPASHSPGFPSGHTSASAVLYLLIAYFWGSTRTRWWSRAVIYGVAAGVVVLVGLSRIVLHRHWPLDVLGGMALGIAVAAGA